MDMNKLTEKQRQVMGGPAWKLLRPRWAGNGPNARPSDEATQLKESLRSENEAGGPFPAQPFGTRGPWA